MSIYGTASLQWTLRVVNNTIVRLKRPLLLIAANAESEPKLPCFRIAANGQFANFTKKIRAQVLKMPSALCLKRNLKHTSMLIVDWLSNVQWSQVKGYHWREAEIASREPQLG